MTAPAEPVAPLPTTPSTDATGIALDRAHTHATAHLASLDEAPVRPTASLETLRGRFLRPLPDEGLDPAAVVDELAANAEGGLVRSAGPRYFGFVVGGGLPAALAADWLTSAWDQNAGLYVIGPAAAVAEETAGGWLAELFGLPIDVSVGFTTGATMASFTDLDRPALVTAQAGNVNTGAFDPLPAIVDSVGANGGWLHVDGAFGLWAAADPSRRHLVEGVGAADSWTTDAHKWLNVPYDSGLSFVRDAAAHHAAMTLG